MDNFAFIIHPIDPKKDVARKFKLLGRYLPVPVIHFLSYYWPPVYLSHVTGVRSLTGRELEGWLIACPLTPTRMLQVRTEAAYKKIVQTGRLAEKLGARILGLGAFTSVVGDAGLTVSKRLDIPVTTGDSYTVAVTLEAVRNAAGRMGIDLSGATVAIVGATGAVGRVCAEILVSEVGSLLLIGRRAAALAHLREHLASGSHTPVTTSCQVDDVRQADVLVTASSALEALIEPQHLKSGAVVCDVARPSAVAVQVLKQRNDVLVIDGGIVEVPGPVSFGFDFGLPRRMAYACMAETMILALEGRYESYTVGRRLSTVKVKEIAQLAEKHGFKLAALRSFERSLSDREIAAIRDRAVQR
jgi:fatty aldehyde-generating acyl-ACP reductase